MHLAYSHRVSLNFSLQMDTFGRLLGIFDLLGTFLTSLAQEEVFETSSAFSAFSALRANLENRAGGCFGELQ